MTFFCVKQCKQNSINSADNNKKMHKISKCKLAGVTFIFLYILLMIAKTAYKVAYMRLNVSENNSSQNTTPATRNSKNDDKSLLKVLH